MYEVTDIDYRTVFNNTEGIKVFNHILSELMFFKHNKKTTEEMVLHNYAMRLLENIGVMSRDSQDKDGQISIEQREKITRNLINLTMENNENE